MDRRKSLSNDDDKQLEDEVLSYWNLLELFNSLHQNHRDDKISAPFESRLYGTMSMLFPVKMQSVPIQLISFEKLAPHGLLRLHKSSLGPLFKKYSRGDPSRHPSITVDPYILEILANYASRPNDFTVIVAMGKEKTGKSKRKTKSKGRRSGQQNPGGISELTTQQFSTRESHEQAQGNSVLDPRTHNFYARSTQPGYLHGPYPITPGSPSLTDSQTLGPPPPAVFMNEPGAGPSSRPTPSGPVMSFPMSGAYQAQIQQVLSAQAADHHAGNSAVATTQNQDGFSEAMNPQQSSEKILDNQHQASVQASRSPLLPVTTPPYEIWHRGVLLPGMPIEAYRHVKFLIAKHYDTRKVGGREPKNDPLLMLELDQLRNTEHGRSACEYMQKYISRTEEHFSENHCQPIRVGSNYASTSCPNQQESADSALRHPGINPQPSFSNADATPDIHDYRRTSESEIPISKLLVDSTITTSPTTFTEISPVSSASHSTSLQDTHIISSGAVSREELPDLTVVESTANLSSNPRAELIPPGSTMVDSLSSWPGATSNFWSPFDSRTPINPTPQLETTDSKTSLPSLQASVVSTMARPEGVVSQSSPERRTGSQRDLASSYRLQPSTEVTTTSIQNHRTSFEGGQQENSESSGIRVNRTDKLAAHRLSTVEGDRTGSLPIPGSFASQLNSIVQRGVTPEHLRAYELGMFENQLNAAFLQRFRCEQSSSLQFQELAARMNPTMSHLGPDRARLFQLGSIWESEKPGINHTVSSSVYPDVTQGSEDAHQSLTELEKARKSYSEKASPRAGQHKKWQTSDAHSDVYKPVVIESSDTEFPAEPTSNKPQIEYHSTLQHEKHIGKAANTLESVYSPSNQLEPSRVNLESDEPSTAPTTCSSTTLRAPLPPSSQQSLHQIGSIAGCVYEPISPPSPPSEEQPSHSGPDSEIDFFRVSKTSIKVQSDFSIQNSDGTHALDSRLGRAVGSLRASPETSRSCKPSCSENPLDLSASGSALRRYSTSGGSSEMMSGKDYQAVKPEAIRTSCKSLSTGGSSVPESKTSKSGAAELEYPAGKCPTPRMMPSATFGSSDEKSGSEECRIGDKISAEYAEKTGSDIGRICDQDAEPRKETGNGASDIGRNRSSPGLSRTTLIAEPNAVVVQACEAVAKSKAENERVRLLGKQRSVKRKSSLSGVPTRSSPRQANRRRASDPGKRQPAQPDVSFPGSVDSGRLIVRIRAVGDSYTVIEPTMETIDALSSASKRSQNNIVKGASPSCSQVHVKAPKRKHKAEEPKVPDDSEQHGVPTKPREKGEAGPGGAVIDTPREDSVDDFSENESSCSKRKYRRNTLPSESPKKIMISLYEREIGCSLAPPRKQTLISRESGGLMDDVSRQRCKSTNLDSVEKASELDLSQKESSVNTPLHFANSNLVTAGISSVSNIEGLEPMAVFRRSPEVPIVHITPESVKPAEHSKRGSETSCPHGRETLQTPVRLDFTASHEERQSGSPEDSGAIGSIVLTEPRRLRLRKSSLLSYTWQGNPQDGINRGHKIPNINPEIACSGEKAMELEDSSQDRHQMSCRGVSTLNPPSITTTGNASPPRGQTENPSDLRHSPPEETLSREIPEKTVSPYSKSDSTCNSEDLIPHVIHEASDRVAVSNCCSEKNRFKLSSSLPDSSNLERTRRFPCTRASTTKLFDAPKMMCQTSEGVRPEELVEIAEINLPPLSNVVSHLESQSFDTAPLEMADSSSADPQQKNEQEKLTDAEKSESVNSKLIVSDRTNVAPLQYSSKSDESGRVTPIEKSSSSSDTARSVATESASECVSIITQKTSSHDNIVFCRLLSTRKLEPKTTESGSHLPSNQNISLVSFDERHPDDVQEVPVGKERSHISSESLAISDQEAARERSVAVIGKQFRSVDPHVEPRTRVPSSEADIITQTSFISNQTGTDSEVIETADDTQGEALGGKIDYIQSPLAVPERSQSSPENHRSEHSGFLPPPSTADQGASVEAHDSRSSSKLSDSENEAVKIISSSEGHMEISRPSKKTRSSGYVSQSPRNNSGNTTIEGSTATIKNIHSGLQIPESTTLSRSYNISRKVDGSKEAPLISENTTEGSRTSSNTSETEQKLPLLPVQEKRKPEGEELTILVEKMHSTSASTARNLKIARVHFAATPPRRNERVEAESSTEKSPISEKNQGSVQPTESPQEESDQERRNHFQQYSVKKIFEVTSSSTETLHNLESLPLFGDGLSAAMMIAPDVREVVRNHPLRDGERYIVLEVTPPDSLPYTPDLVVVERQENSIRTKVSALSQFIGESHPEKKDRSDRLVLLTASRSFVDNQSKSFRELAKADKYQPGSSKERKENIREKFKLDECEPGSSSTRNEHNKLQRSDRRKRSHEKSFRRSGSGHIDVNRNCISCRKLAKTFMRETESSTVLEEAGLIPPLRIVDPGHPLEVPREPIIQNTAADPIVIGDDENRENREFVTLEALISEIWTERLSQSPSDLMQRSLPASPEPTEPRSYHMPIPPGFAEHDDHDTTSSPKYIDNSN